MTGGVPSPLSDPAGASAGSHECTSQRWLALTGFLAAGAACLTDGIWNVGGPAAAARIGMAIQDYNFFVTLNAVVSAVSIWSSVPILLYCRVRGAILLICGLSVVASLAATAAFTLDIASEVKASLFFLHVYVNVFVLTMWVQMITLFPRTWFPDSERDSAIAAIGVTKTIAGLTGLIFSSVFTVQTWAMVLVGVSLTSLLVAWLFVADEPKVPPSPSAAEARLKAKTLAREWRWYRLPWLQAYAMPRFYSVAIPFFLLGSCFYIFEDYLGELGDSWDCPGACLSTAGVLEVISVTVLLFLSGYVLGKGNKHRVVLSSLMLVGLVVTSATVAGAHLGLKTRMHSVLIGMVGVSFGALFAVSPMLQSTAAEMMTAGKGLDDMNIMLAMILGMYLTKMILVQVPLAALRYGANFGDAMLLLICVCSVISVAVFNIGFRNSYIENARNCRECSVEDGESPLHPHP